MLYRKKKNCGDLLGSPVVKKLPSSAGGSIPGGESKIPHVVGARTATGLASVLHWQPMEPSKYLNIVLQKDKKCGDTYEELVKCKLVKCLGPFEQMSH